MNCFVFHHYFFVRNVFDSALGSWLNLLNNLLYYWLLLYHLLYNRLLNILGDRLDYLGGCLLHILNWSLWISQSILTTYCLLNYLLLLLLSLLSSSIRIIVSLTLCLLSSCIWSLLTSSIWIAVRLSVLFFRSYFLLWLLIISEKHFKHF